MSRRRNTKYAANKDGTAYKADIHSEWSTGAQSVGVRRRPCQLAMRELNQ